MHASPEDHLIQEAKKIVKALGKMFAPFCEVVLHDLRSPDHAIVAIENNMSGRKLGDATTNIGLERIRSQEFPDIVQNYPNTLPGGHRVKSTSIGIRNQQGVYIASICLNFDISSFSTFGSQISEFVSTSVAQLPLQERLKAATVEDVHAAMHAFAQERNRPLAQLTPVERRELVHALNQKGYFVLRNSTTLVAKALQVTRPTIYNDLKREV